MKYGIFTLRPLRALTVPLLVFALCSSRKDSAPQTGEKPQVTLKASLLKTRHTEDSTVITIGATVRLSHGWHTYWLNPGESGLAPRFKTASPGVRLEPAHLSPPVRITDDNGVTFGYHDSMQFVINARSDRRATGEISLIANLLICKGICLPVSCTTSVAIGAEQENGHQYPETGFGTVDTALSATFHETDTTLQLVIHKSGWKSARPRIETLFPVTQGIAELSIKPRFTLSGDTLFADLRRPQLGTPVPDTVEGLLVLQVPEARRGLLFRATSEAVIRNSLPVGQPPH
jgi:DsbC/DsbD-like thiol-disulfide interchange protein